jgi:hypothetical protein
MTKYVIAFVANGKAYTPDGQFVVEGGYGGNYEVVRYDPQDQYAKVVPLAMLTSCYESMQAGRSTD